MGPERSYFAYGADLAPARMHGYGVGYRNTSLGFLRDWRIAFDHYSSRWDCGVADIVPADGDVVEGVLYTLCGGSDALTLLDRAKKVVKGRYQRVRVRVAAVAYGAIVEAFAYRVSDPGNFIAPSKRYLAHIQTEGMHHGFDTDYLHYLRLTGANRARVAVYGTLKRGQRRHGLLERDAVRFVERRAIPGYALFATPFGYPAAVPLEKVPDEYAVDKTAVVHCEVYEMPRSLLDELDEVEGAPHLFRRARVGEVYLYLWNGALDERFTHLPHGRWPFGKKIVQRR